MAPTFPPYPPLLSKDELENLKNRAIDWELAHGLVMRPLSSTLQLLEVSREPSSLSLHAPIALFPTPFPASCYNLAVEVQPAFNKLYMDLSFNSEFIHGAMKNLIKIDDFQARLYEIYSSVEEQGSVQPVSLGLFRSDYILHAQTENELSSDEHASMKQVEFNTISVSFGSLATRVTQLHKYLRDTTRFHIKGRNPILHGKLPENDAIAGLGSGLADAHKTYLISQKCPSAEILMIVQDGERNVFDQMHIEFYLWNSHGIVVRRTSLSQFETSYKVDYEKPTRPLTRISDGTEISVVYFRAGYSPEDYHGDAEWNARKHIEMSGAIKSPTVAMQLVGAKKVQQLLVEEGELEKHMSKEQANVLRATFTGLYSLGHNAEGEASTKMALENPERFVMKPQREGGGNNIYRRKIVDVLSKLSPLEREAYILMDIIEPPPLRNVLLKNGNTIECDIISELGIFGAILGSPERGIQFNRVAGHLLRTKAKEHEEGGVAVGFAVIDSPLLI